MGRGRGEKKREESEEEERDEKTGRQVGCGEFRKGVISEGK